MHAVRLIRSVSVGACFRQPERPHTKQQRTLGRPVARRPGAIFLAGENHHRHFFPKVLFGSLEDGGFLAGRQVAGEGALLLGDQLVLQMGIAERSAHQHLVIAATRAVVIETADKTYHPPTALAS
jgi:hypothetical protein